MPLTRERADCEMWWRNPQYYIEQCVNVGTFNFTWDFGYLVKRNLDHLQWVSSYCRGYYWRSMVIKQRYSTLWDAQHRTHIALWPTWSARYDSWADLVKLIERPWSKYGAPMHFTGGLESPTSQQHIIVISDLPSYAKNASKRDKERSLTFWDDLKAAQEDHPEVTFFIHGMYSIGKVLNDKYKIMDFEVRNCVAGGQVITQGGGHVMWDEIDKFWPNMMGRSKESLRKPGIRCEFSMEMLLWNAAYWNSVKRFGVKSGKVNGDLIGHIKENHLIFTKRLVRRPGDRIVCDDCSLWLHCKYYREGAICAVPHTDMDSVGKLFGTRNAEDIIKGLGKLLEVQVGRAQSGITAEQEGSDDRPAGKIDPALNKLMADIESGAVNLLKLVDPAYRNQPGKVQINVGTGGHAQLAGGTPEQAARELTSRAIAALEAEGFSRDEITTEMVKNTIRQITAPALEA